ncbi:MAG TPA: SpoIIE family protein phosphatase [Kiritimatiellia bacterium]|nr:SpoIIE family protein phosphatase [Kiritimatiellia bacterium]
MPTGIKFVYKIILLMIACILFTGISIAVISALQFRHDIFKQELGSSFTVYQAALNYLTGHYKSQSHRNQFVPRSLDFVLRNKFLTSEGEGGGLEITHRPNTLAIYYQDGGKVYEFNVDESVFWPDIITPEEIPFELTYRMDIPNNTIQIAGPIDPSGAVPGYVFINMPTDIGDRLRALYLKSAITLLAGIFIAALLAFYFSRRFLAPVQALTDAARRVHSGDYSCRIEHVANDEIGLLTSTFNEMVSSWVRRLSLMHRIQEWTLQVGHEFDRHRLYERLLDMFHNVAGARQCALFLRDGAKKPVAPVAVKGDEITRAEISQWIRFTIEKGEPVLAERSGADAGASLAKVSEMVLPLISNDNVIGAVYIGPPASGPAYDVEMVATLQTLSQHAGIAVENARLLNEVAEKKRIEQEMMWARDIQQTLLPHNPPDISGYTIHGFSLPANEVGGDYFDYIPRENNLYHIIVSDVSGKGVAAGLIMSVLRSLVHTYSEFEQSPHEILLRVNRVLTRDLDEYMFVTAAMMTLEPKDHVLRIARAGHEPVLILSERGEIQWIKPEGTALGLLDVGSFESHFDTAVYHMQPGDVALLYTDGVNEAQNSQGEEFGIDRLVDLVCSNRTMPVESLLEKIVQEVKSFTGERHQQDDITLVALRRNAE